MDNDGEPLSDHELRETALSGVRDSLAGLQRVPAAGLDAEKSETVRDTVDKIRALERSLTNEVEQMRDSDGDSNE